MGKRSKPRGLRRRPAHLQARPLLAIAIVTALTAGAIAGVLLMSGSAAAPDAGTQAW